MTTVSSHAASTLELDRPKTDAPAPLRAVHTTNFPALLQQLGASLLVTTYQAGRWSRSCGSRRPCRRFSP
jgi:hypothetical protein